MKLAEAYTYIRDSLAAYGSDESVYEARVILQSVLNISPTSLFGHPEMNLTEYQINSINQCILRRESSEPLAYITREREFYGLSFYVDPRVLIPRPETELIVERALDYINLNQMNQNTPIIIADIGTGSANIAVSIATNAKNVFVYAFDISPLALQVARINVERHGLQNTIQLVQDDISYRVPLPFNLVVANLPYIKQGGIQHLDKEIRLNEPLLALNGGEDGLFVIRNLISRLPNIVAIGARVIIECGYDQATVLEHYVATKLPRVRRKLFRDLNHVPRVMELDFLSSQIS